jgi:hypothetical protein
MDIEVFMTVASVFAVAITCGVITYRVSIAHAKREIETAFREHIERMHTDHKEFVEAVIEETSKD